jgi:hypothetical protein
MYTMTSDDKHEARNVAQLYVFEMDPDTVRQAYREACAYKPGPDESTDMLREHAITRYALREAVSLLFG